MRKRPIALLVLALLALTACGGQDGTTEASSGESTTSPSASAAANPAAASEPATQGTLEGVTISGQPGEAPSVKIEDPPYSVDETTVQVLDEGSGDAMVADGNRVTARLLAVNGRDGKSIDDSSGPGNPPATLDVSKGQLLAGLYRGLLGQREGSRVAIAVPPADAFGAEGFPQAGVQPDDTIILVVDIEKIEEVAAPLPMAEGTPKQPPAGLPALQTDDEGIPTGFSADEQTDKKLDELVVAPVIVGDGSKTEQGQTLTVHYLGALYPDGEVFDQSWTRGEPFDFQLGAGGVIQGWDQGLVGQPVGSRVILAIPPDLAYGEQGSPPTIPPNAPLIFAVDILAAS